MMILVTVLTLLVVALPLCCVLFRTIHLDGLMCGSAVLSICMIFYLIVPLLYLLFPGARDDSMHFNVLLSTFSTEELLMEMLLCAVLLAFMTLAYVLRRENNRLTLPNSRAFRLPRMGQEMWQDVNRRSLRWLLPLAHGLLFLGVLSMLMCIHGAGGLSTYLALGALTRGIGKDASSLLPSSYLPFVTLSVVILAPPYLYRFALRSVEKPWCLHLLFWLSLLMALLYLLYNQGRLPLLLFLLPFVLDWKPVRRMGIFGLLLLFLLSCLSLELLQRLFSYLAYGVWRSPEGSSLLEVVLREFTYPFSNFANRDTLMRTLGYRLGIDLVQWPVIVLPSGVSRLVGIDKSTFTTLAEELTSAYAAVTELPTAGGIPADMMFFLYAQGGYFTLLAGQGILMRLLYACDTRLKRLQCNEAARLLVIRAALLSVSCVNNFDISVILRTRTDLLVMLAVLLTLSRSAAEEGSI